MEQKSCSTVEMEIERLARLLSFRVVSVCVEGEKVKNVVGPRSAESPNERRMARRSPVASFGPSPL